MTDTTDDGYAPDTAVARYFGVHIKSIARWDKRPGLDFPKPIVINGRNFRKWSEIRDFVRRAAVAHARNPPRSRQTSSAEISP
jgi:hypothetical protein